MQRYISKTIFVVFFVIASYIVSLHTISAQESFEVPLQEFRKAQVVSIEEEGEREIVGTKNPYQLVKLKILEDPEKDKEITIEHGGIFSLEQSQKVKEGDVVVLLKSENFDGSQSYHIVDRYRLDTILTIAFFFFVLVLTVSRWKGLGSMVGLAISFLVILNFIVPNILAGKDPVLISIGGSLFIMATTLYFAHGFSQKTTIALLSTFITLTITAILASVSVQLTHLTGLGSEEAYSLRFGNTAGLNFQGLLLGGMIIGALGVLDDITTSQSAAVYELAHANHKFKFSDLVKRGLRIGQEHISSLVNTLVLAYAGASLPLFIFFSMNPTNQPMWVLLNSEFIAEEIIRTLSGSIGLILAVPITTTLAAWSFTNKSFKFD